MWRCGLPVLAVFASFMCMAGCADRSPRAPAPPIVEPSGPAVPTPPQHGGDLAGDWEAAFDGSVIRIRKEGDAYVGRYSSISSALKEARFSVDEIALRGFRPAGGKSYRGEVKWRHDDKREEWKEGVITLEGENLTITPGRPSLFGRIQPKSTP
jgi:hypothetical protein